MSRGYEVWYILKTTHPLHEYLRQISAALDTARFPAHICLAEPTPRADTAALLANAYRLHDKPQFDMPTFPTIARTQSMRYIQFNLRASIDKNRTWSLIVAQAPRDFCNDELGRIMANYHLYSTTIHPSDYRIAVMDCRSRDPAEWHEIF